MAAGTAFMLTGAHPVAVARWIGHHLVVYAIVAAGAGLAFLVAATVYSGITALPVEPAATQPATPITQPTFIPVVPSESISPFQKPSSPSEAVASLATATPSSALRASIIVGLQIYGPNKERLGTVTDIVLDRRGGGQAIILSLDGYWMTKKTIVIPFEKVNWETTKPRPTAGIDSDVGAPKFGTIPYTLTELQKLPVSSFPVMMNAPSKN